MRSRPSLTAMAGCARGGGGSLEYEARPEMMARRLLGGLCPAAGDPASPRAGDDDRPGSRRGARRWAQGERAPHRVVPSAGDAQAAAARATGTASAQSTVLPMSPDKLVNGAQALKSANEPIHDHDGSRAHALSVSAMPRILGDGEPGATGRRRSSRPCAWPKRTEVPAEVAHYRISAGVENLSGSATTRPAIPSTKVDTAVRPGLSDYRSSFRCNTGNRPRTSTRCEVVYPLAAQGGDSRTRRCSPATYRARLEMGFVASGLARRSRYDICRQVQSARFMHRARCRGRRCDHLRV